MSKGRLPSPVLPFDAVPLAVVEAAKKLFNLLRWGVQSEAKIGPGPWSARVGDVYPHSSVTID